MKADPQTAPDLDEAFNAVRGLLFGPIDPAQVKLKHKEIVQDAKEKREQEINPRGGLSLARGDHAERDRKEREHQTHTLTWLLANDIAYREAHERAMSSFTNAGNAIDRAIEAGEKARERVRQQIDDYLASTARLKDGRTVMVDEDGTCRDQNGAPISAEDAAEVEGQPKRAFKPYDEMRQRKDGIDRDLAELRGWSVEVGDMTNRAMDQENPTRGEPLVDDKAYADDLVERAQEMQRGFERNSPESTVQRERMAEESLGSTATMAIPKLP